MSQRLLLPWQLAPTPTGPRKSLSSAPFLSVAVPALPFCPDPGVSSPGAEHWAGGVQERVSGTLTCLPAAPRPLQPSPEGGLQEGTVPVR